MNYEKLVTTIYSEEDLGRSVATAIAGATGLIVYILRADWAIAFFTAVIVFPLVRVIVTAARSRWKTRRAEIAQTLKAEADFKKFSPEERQVLEFFVRKGGCCVSWSAVNASEHPFPRPAVNSLMERGLVRTSVMEDGMSESFVLDVDTFDLAQRAFVQKHAAEQLVGP